MTLGHFLFSLLAGAVVYFVGCAFDKSSNNRYAGYAGLATFVLVFLGIAYVG